MTERIEKLETELAAMRPRETSPELMQRIEARIEDARPWGDRMLIAAMSMGALAAGVIICVLLVQIPPAPSLPAPMATTSEAPRLGDSSRMLAQANGRWLEALK